MWIRNRTTLIVVVTGGVFLVLAASSLSMTVQEHTRLKHERAALLDAKTRYEALKRTHQDLANEVATIKQRVLRSGLGIGPLVIPAFVKHAETLAQEEGVLISAIIPGSREDTPDGRRIPFGIELTGEFGGLHRFLSRLERSRPPVRIERLLMIQGNGTRRVLSIECAVFTAEKLLGAHDPSMIDDVTFRVLTAAAGDKVSEGEHHMFSYPSPPRRHDAPLRSAEAGTRRLDGLGTVQLSAILFDGSRSTAIVGDTVLHIGDSYKGHTVVAIERDHLILGNDQDRRVIRLTEK